MHKRYLQLIAAAFVALANPTTAFHTPRQASLTIRSMNTKTHSSTLPSPSSTQLGLVNEFSSLSSFEVASLLSTDNIKVAFSVATFLPQIFWLFLILIPNASFTKNLMGGYEIVTLCCLVHFFIVTASIIQPDGTAPMAQFADVFDPSGDPQKAMVGMMQYPNFVSEEWSHVLTWDLFVGRWIWLDGLRRGIFTSHSVLLCNLIGPPGLLLHWATCVVVGKGLPGNEAIDEEV